MAERTSPIAESSLSQPRLVTNPWIILLVLSAGFFMILLDTTIVNVAIPSMVDGLHASLDQILWVVNGYILVYAVLLITTGRLGDMFGPRRLFLTGLVVFTLSSAACGIAQDPNQLIFFRVIQGLGGAILTPQSLSIITSIFPPEKRGAAFGVWGAVAGIAAIAGPTLGGFLTTSFTWRAIFYVNVPIGIAVIVLAFLVMPEVTIHREHHLDIGGVLLASVGLFALVFGLIEGERYNWGPVWTAGRFDVGPLHASLISIPTILAAAVIVLAIFGIGEARTDEPLLPLSLFRDRNFSVGNVVSAIIAFGMLSLFLPLTIFLQSVLGLSAEDAGVVFVPMTLTSTIVAPFAGRLADRFSGKYLLCAGLACFALGMGLVIWVASLSASGTTFTPALIVAGLGMGFTFAPLIATTLRDVAPSQAGAASGFLNTTRQVGGAMGTAIVGALLQNRLGVELHNQGVRYSAQLPAQFRSSFVSGFSHAAKGGFQIGRGQTGAAAHLPAGLPAAVAQHLQALGVQVFHHAYLNAMKPSLGLSIAVIALGALTTLFMRSPAGEEGAVAEPELRGAPAAAGE